MTIDAAKKDLTRLIDAGEDVLIVEGGTPTAKLVGVAKSPFKIGLLEGQLIGDGPDFFEPMAEADLALWEGRE